MLYKSKNLLFNPYFIIAWIFFLVFLLGPQLTLYGQDPEFYIDPIYFSIIGVSLFFISTIFSLVSFKFLNILIGRKIEKLHFFLVFLLCFILISIASPVFSETYNNMTGLNHHINLPIFLINLLASFVLSRSLHKIQLFFKFILLAALTSFLLLSFSNIKKFAHPENFDSVQFGERNLIVISLDGVPGINFNKLINTPENKKFFKDFINFENSFSHGVATYASIFTEFYGGPNWKLIAKTEDDLEELNKLFSEKNDFTQNSYIYGEYKKIKSQNSIVLAPEKTTGSNDLDQSIELVSSSFCSWGFCSLGEKYGNFKKYAAKFLPYGFETRQIKSLEDFNIIIQSFEKSDIPVRVFMGHFIFTHFPISYDKNCSYIGSKFIEQNEKSVDELTKCAILSLKKVVTKLKNSGLYDNSYIVFKSDHGKPVLYFNEGEQSIKINENIKWGYDRYRPFVMTKKPFANNQILSTEKRPFFLSDLREVYNLYNSDNIPNKGYIDLIGSSEIQEQIKSKRTFIFIPEEAKSSFKYDYHIPLQVDRDDINSVKNKILELHN